MTAAALVFVFGLQAVGAPGAAEVTGQVLTRDGVPAAAVRVSAVAAPPPDARPQDGSQYYQAPPPVRSVLTGVDGRFIGQQGADGCAVILEFKHRAVEVCPDDGGELDQ